MSVAVALGSTADAMIAITFIRRTTATRIAVSFFIVASKYNLMVL
jgi:hypothetical protein